MRLLDRAFGTLAFPWDMLLPSFLWWALCVALLASAGRRLGALRLAGWLGAGNAAAWCLFFALFSWSASIEAIPRPLLLAEWPAAALWQAIDAALWWTLGLAGPGSPSVHFASAYDGGDGWLPAAASLANQSLLLALAALPLKLLKRKHGQATLS